MPRYKWEKLEKDFLQKIIDESDTFTEVMRKIGYQESYAKDNGKKIITKMAEVKELNIDNLSLHTSLKENRIKEGDVFDKWTVLKLLPSTNKCLCRCECGKEKEVYKTHLRSGHSKSCGDCHSLKEGQKIGILTVLEKDLELSSQKGESYFKCQCRCGTIKSIRAKHLKRGMVASCGCLTSKGNELIYKLLKENNFSFEKEYSFEDLRDKDKLRFDFAIFNDDGSLKCLIEYQGRQHYEASEFFGGKDRLLYQQHHDKLKKDYCIKNNIKLIEILYRDYDKINLLFLKKLIDEM